MSSAHSVDALRFQRDGFIIVRDVFSQDEVARLRSAAERAAERAATDGLIIRPIGGQIAPITDLVGLAKELGEVVFDERMLRIARGILGRDELVYFGDSGMIAGGSTRGFHKDNTCRNDPSHPDWTTPYTLIRFGIYLEDHEHHSGGLKVRRGSHLHPDVTTGEIVAVPSRPGDVVVWSLRTTHSGHAVRVRGLPWLQLPPRFEARLPRPIALEESCRRVALFCTYGLDDAHLERYVAKHADGVTFPDNYLYKGWLYSDPDPAWLDLARSRGVKFLRPIREWGALRGNPAPEGYVPIGTAKPDTYALSRSEALIRMAGRAVRKISPRRGSRSASRSA